MKYSKNEIQAVDFIKKIKTTGESAKCYFIEKQVFQDVDGSDAHGEYLPTMYFNEEDARTAINALIPTLEADFGEYLSINLMYGTVEPDDLENLDWEAIENHGEECFTDANLFDIINENDSAEDIEYFYKYYEYKKLEGSILVFWSWQQHVGYCRKFEDVRYAYNDEDEKMCIKEDRTYNTQCDVLCEAGELEGLSREEIRDLVSRKLGENHWKWQNDAVRIFNEYVSL